MMANPWPDDLQMTRDTTPMFDNDGGDNTTVVGRVMRPGTVASVEFVPNWSLTGAATNNRTFTLINGRSDGLGTTTVAALTMAASTSFVKSTPKVIPVTTANLTLAVGDILRWESVHNGTGMADPGGVVIVQQTYTY